MKEEKHKEAGKLSTLHAQDKKDKAVTSVVLLRSRTLEMRADLNKKMHGFFQKRHAHHSRHCAVVYRHTSGSNVAADNN